MFGWACFLPHRIINPPQYLSSNMYRQCHCETKTGYICWYLSSLCNNHCTECCSAAKCSTCERRVQLWPGPRLHKQSRMGREQWQLCSYAAGLLTCLPSRLICQAPLSVLVVCSTWKRHVYLPIIGFTERTRHGITDRTKVKGDLPRCSRHESSLLFIGKCCSDI